MSTKSEFIKVFNECPRDSVLSNLMLGLGKNEEFLIGNNHGCMNGWAKRSNIFGLVTKIL